MHFECDSTFNSSDEWLTQVSRKAWIVSCVVLLAIILPPTNMHAGDYVELNVNRAENALRRRGEVPSIKLRLQDEWNCRLRLLLLLNSFKAPWHTARSVACWSIPPQTNLRMKSRNFVSCKRWSSHSERLTSSAGTCRIHVVIIMIFVNRQSTPPSELPPSCTWCTWFHTAHLHLLSNIDGLIDQLRLRMPSLSPRPIESSTTRGNGTTHNDPANKWCPQTRPARRIERDHLRHPAG